MRDLAFVAFLLVLLGLAVRRPFLFALVYCYVDIVAPQRLSYYLLNSIPFSLITAGLAAAGWLLFDDKRGFRIAPRQLMMLILLIYATFTTFYADFPVEAWSKWDWAAKSVAWAIFLPFTLRTRLRIEAYLLFMTLSAATIIIVGGIKTALSGGGYGSLNLMVSNYDSGLYESSTISTFAIATIPIILWLARHGTVFRRDWRVVTFAYALIFACLLIPIGTQARTGLICIAALAFLSLRDVKRRFIYIAALAGAMTLVVPLLPESYTSRMSTISNYEADSSAGTRLAVWEWTWDYAQRNPLGGGFDAYRQNKLNVRTVDTATAGQVLVINEETMEQSARAYHSAYFEMLGEQGFPGLILFLLIHGIGLVRMELIRRRYQHAEGEDRWISPLATALQNAQLIYLVGALFVGMAYQPYIYMLLGTQIGFDQVVRRRERAAAQRPFARPFSQPAPEGAA